MRHICKLQSTLTIVDVKDLHYVKWPINWIQKSGTLVNGIIFKYNFTCFWEFKTVKYSWNWNNIRHFDFIFQNYSWKFGFRFQWKWIKLEFNWFTHFGVQWWPSSVIHSEKIRHIGNIIQIWCFKYLRRFY